MNKILGIIVLSLLLSGCISPVSKEVQKEFIDNGIIKIGMNMSDLWPLVKNRESKVMVPNWDTDPKYLLIRTSFFQNGQAYLAEATNSDPKSNYATWGTVQGWKLENYKLIKIYENTIDAYDHIISLEKDPRMLSHFVEIKNSLIKYEEKPTTTTTQSNTASAVDIEFTIKDKKEQCTAIGFEPATEKFADCVLRLVELDVKSQQATQIALAQSQGNQQVAEQLKKQNNSQSSQYFLDLSQKLLNPQSTVSAPSTSTCRVIGSGAYKTVNCW